MSDLMIIGLEGVSQLSRGVVSWGSINAYKPNRYSYWMVVIALLESQVTDD